MVGAQVASEAERVTFDHWYGDQQAINNDGGLPNARQIAFGDFPRDGTLSHNTIFSAAPIPLRTH